MQTGRPPVRVVIVTGADVILRRVVANDEKAQATWGAFGPGGGGGVILD